jgi:hypothetical protein
MHIGFILNRPTNVELAALLPDYAPAKQVTAPVFIGGPDLVDALFAIVPSAHAPADYSIELSPGLFMGFRDKDLLRIIERFPGDARFFVGVVGLGNPASSRPRSPPAHGWSSSRAWSWCSTAASARCGIGSDQWTRSSA